MEIVTRRSPIDYSREPGEINLVDWFKGMVSSRLGEEIMKPLIEAQPSPRALKRALLVFLRCIDLDANKRPKWGRSFICLRSIGRLRRDTLFRPLCRYPQKFHI